MGCFHTLQPERDPYLPPSVPALTVQGFVRWQTVQLLLEPDEHAAFLQNAVKRLDIINPADGTPFPDRLPREALPSRPDPEMIQWHGGVSENLRLESHHSDLRGLPIGESAQNSDVATDGSDDRPSVNDNAHYSTQLGPRVPLRPPPSIRVARSIEAPPIGNPRDPHPWDLERRRSSTSDLRSTATSLRRGQSSAPSVFSPESHSHDSSRPRSPSTVSTSSISSSSSSSLTTSSMSMSPTLRQNSRHPNHPQRRRQAQGQHPSHGERRHSSHGPNSPRQVASGRNVQARLPALGDRPRQHPPRPPPSNSRGLNMQWGDRGNGRDRVERPVDVSNQMTIQPYKEPKWRSIQDRDARRARSGSAGGSASPLRGVGGRRYAAEGTSWS